MKKLVFPLSSLVLVCFIFFGFNLGINEHEIKITGDEKFTQQVNDALDLLKDKDTEAYEIACKYIKVIEQGSHSGMWAYKDPPTYELNDQTAYYSLTWCAGTIAHDSYHSKLYHDYKEANGEPVPDEVWTGLKAEQTCIAYQIKVAINIEAPQNELDYLKSLDGTHYDLDGDGDCDWDDYTKRNW